MFLVTIFGERHISMKSGGVLTVTEYAVALLEKGIALR